MLLAIDAGNTNVVFAVYNGTERLAVWRCQTESGRTSDEYGCLLGILFVGSQLDFSMIKNVIISSVVPAANENLRRFCRTYLNAEPVFIGKDCTALNLMTKLEPSVAVGADRLVNALAVRDLYRTPAVVVDFGTATTFDVVDTEGAYCGGVIAPGINLSVKALHQAAAMLPHISVRKPEKVIGTNTIDAMQSGLFYGYIGLVEGLIRRIADEMKVTSPFVLATGGLASLFAGATPEIHDVDEDLTLRGLYHIFTMSRFEGKIHGRA